MDAVLHLLYRAFMMVLDVKFLCGTLLGWRFVHSVFGRPDAIEGPAQDKEVKELQELVATLKEELVLLKQELGRKNHDLADAASRLNELDFGRLTLEGQVCQLEARCAALEEELKVAGEKAAAEATRLSAVNTEMWDQLRAATTALEAAQQARGRDTAAAPAAEPTAATGVAAALRQQAGGPSGSGSSAAEEEVSALREQLAAVLAQNADLQERLMEIAFNMPPQNEHSEGAFSPEPSRRPRHRPLAEDEEIQRRIAESASQGLVGEDSEEDEQPSSPLLLATAQRQLAAYQELKSRLGAGRQSVEGANALAGGEEEEEALSSLSSQSPFAAALSASTSAATEASPPVGRGLGSPRGVVGSTVGSEVGTVLAKAGGAGRGEGEEVASSG